MATDDLAVEPAKKPVPLALMIVVAALLAIGDVALWLLVALVCGLREDGPHVTATCVGNHVRPLAWLPLAGAVAVVLSVPLARRTGRNAVFAAGTALALAAGGCAWNWL